MNVAGRATVANKRRYARLAAVYSDPAGDSLDAALAEFFAKDAAFHVVHPINDVAGLGDYRAGVIAPLQHAFRHLHRRCDMLFGGHSDGDEWVVSHGHYVGEFAQPWLGIPASGDMAMLHYAEYCRMDGGRAVECFLYLDMLGLLRQLGRWPVPPSGGWEGPAPGPATSDGVLLAGSSRDESERTLATVERMLAGLYTDDEAWRPYWHPNMCWYGPAGYGSFVGVDGFSRFQLPYENIFDPTRIQTAFRQSGDPALAAAVNGHFARFADGHYAALGGWPSHGGFLVNDWLGVRAEGQMFTVRVADLYRRQGDKVAENWVFVDVIDMLRQLGVDAFARAGIEIRL